MVAENIIRQNEIIDSVLSNANVNLIGVSIGDAFCYCCPVVEVRCYASEIGFETNEESVTLENEEFDLEIGYDDGEFIIGLKTQNLGELGYIERVI